MKIALRTCTITAYSAPAWPEVAHVWETLAEVSPFSSFFLTKEWTESWLDVFGSLLKPEILVFHGGGQPVGACLLVRRTERRGPIPIRRVYLNTAGEDEDDSSCIEFNSLLCLDGWEGPAATALCAHLQSKPWDELALDGGMPGPPVEALAAAFPGLDRIETGTSSFYVDLAELRQSQLGFEGRLSRNTREQLRRSKKLYGESGEIRVEAATSTAGALDMLMELARFHQQSWVARGRPGVFASRRFLAFHQALIRVAFPQAGIQLLRIAAGPRVIALLYNFVRRGKVYFYQSGLQYSKDNRLKPGLVAHACAIQTCLEQGLDEYDFLAGDSRYKQSLATKSRPLVWLVLRKRNLKSRAVDLLRLVKQKVQKR